MAKFKKPTPSVDPIYARHEGPYSLMLARRVGDNLKTKMERKMYPTGSSCHQAVLRWFEEEDVDSISVWSEACKYWITTYSREDAEKYGTS